VGSVWRFTLWQTEVQVKAQPNLNNPLRNLSLTTGHNFANKNLFHSRGLLVHKTDEVKTTSSFSVPELTPVTICSPKNWIHWVPTALSSWMRRVHGWLGCSKGVCLCTPSKIQVFVHGLLFYAPSSHTTAE